MDQPYQINEIELSYKRNVICNELPTVQKSETAYNILYGLWDQNRIEMVEDFKMLLLDRAAKVLGIYNVCSGGTSGVIVDPKLIFIAALKTNAHSIILAHNHPSGNLKPSQQDIKFTQRLMDAGQLLEITLHDHLIITNDGYYSIIEQSAYKKTNYGGQHYFEVDYPF